MKQLSIENFSIDKSNWIKVKFGDVVYEPKESVKDPVAEGIEHVVGLEHIDSDDIHLHRSASIDESTTFTKKFAKGDVLFGRRRAYLRKAAQANFEGICSGDITVMRAKDNLMTELLPFIVNNEKFFDYAITHSAGGLSPRVKFKDLAKYEFLLPPKDKQADLATLLNAIDEVAEKGGRVFSELNTFFSAERKHLIERGVDGTGPSEKLRFGYLFQGWETRKLGEFCKLIGGNAFKSPNFKEKGAYQVLRIGNLTENGFNFEKAPVFLDDIPPAELKYLIPKGAVIVSLTGTNGKRDYGFPSLMVEDMKYLLNQRLVMLLVNTEIMTPEFLFLLSKMELFQGRFFLNATGTANQANVSISDVADIELPIPSINDQIRIVKQISHIESCKENSKNTIVKAQYLQKKLINQVF